MNVKSPVNTPTHTVHRATAKGPDRAKVKLESAPLETFVKTEQPADVHSAAAVAAQPEVESPVVGAAEFLEMATTGGVQAAMGANLPPTVAVPAGSSFVQGFVDGYLSPSVIKDRCRALAKEFPDLVEIIETGVETRGYDGKKTELQGPDRLFYMRLGPKTEDRDQKTGVFQFASPHARELVNPMSMMELTEQLVRNYDPNSEDPEVQANTRLLDQLDVFVAPMTNPDGANFALYDDAGWRKNRVPTVGRSVGVDVNRNYPYQWEPSSRPDGQTYSGTGPASEKETQNLLQVVKDHSNIKYVVDWHSYSEEIRRPLGASEKDNAVYDDLHERVRTAIRGVAKHDYQPTVSQVTNGSSDDHFYHVEGIFSTVVETGKEFQPRKDEALVVMRESVAGAREFLQAAVDYSRPTGA